MPLGTVSHTVASAHEALFTGVLQETLGAALSRCRTGPVLSPSRLPSTTTTKAHSPLHVAFVSACARGRRAGQALSSNPRRSPRPIFWVAFWLAGQRRGTKKTSSGHCSSTCSWGQPPTGPPLLLGVWPCLGHGSPVKFSRVPVVLLFFLLHHQHPLTPISCTQLRRAFPSCALPLVSSLLFFSSPIHPSTASAF